uniref:Uncharacterized protein n=1 Tax=viral metagenome TaxID=1070528 RepID=A0A6C0JJX2_9ZZZZ
MVSPSIFCVLIFVATNVPFIVVEILLFPMFTGWPFILFILLVNSVPNRIVDILLLPMVISFELLPICMFSPFMLLTDKLPRILVEML